jgi:MFS family permease
MQYAFGPIFAMLLEALGGGRSTTALVGSLAVGIMDGVGGIFSGWFVLRIGARRTCFLGALLATLGWSLSALVGESWQLLLTYSFIVGVGHSLSLYAAVMTANRWFSHRLALAHAAGSTGGALSPFLSGLLAPSLAHAVGWRHAFLVFAAINGTVLSVAAIWLLPPPETATDPSHSVSGMTLAPDSAESEQESPPPVAVPYPPELVSCAAVKTQTADSALVVPADNFPAKDAGMVVVAAHPAMAAVSEGDAGLIELWRYGRRNSQLKLVLVACFLFGMGSWISVVHMVQLALDNGFAEAEASRLTTYMSIGSLALRIPFGVSADACGRITIVAFGSACLCVIHLVVAIPVAAASYAFLVVYALGVGGFNGAVFSTLPAVPTELVPGRLVNIMSAAIFSPLGVGMVAGPPIASAMQEAYGSYTPAMILASSCFAICLAIFMYILCFTELRKNGRYESDQGKTLADIKS